MLRQKNKKTAIQYNTNMQYYKNVPLKLIIQDKEKLKESEWYVNNTKVNALLKKWLPQSHWL